MTQYLFPCFICLISSSCNNHGEMKLRKAKLGPPVHKVTGNSLGSPDFHQESNSQIHLFLKNQESGNQRMEWETWVVFPVLQMTYGLFG